MIYRIGRAAAITLAVAATVLAGGCQGRPTAASTDHPPVTQSGASATPAAPALAGAPQDIMHHACTAPRTLAAVAGLADTTPVYSSDGVPMCQWTDTTGLTVRLALAADPHGSVPSSTGWRATTVNGHAAADRTKSEQPGCTVLVAVGTGTVQIDTYRDDPGCRTATQVATDIIPQ